MVGLQPNAGRIETRGIIRFPFLDYTGKTRVKVVKYLILIITYIHSAGYALYDVHKSVHSDIYMSAILKMLHNVLMPTMESCCIFLPQNALIKKQQRYLMGKLESICQGTIDPEINIEP